MEREVARIDQVGLLAAEIVKRAHFDGKPEIVVAWAYEVAEEWLRQGRQRGHIQYLSAAADAEGNA